jgi:hypothetical protein
MSDYRVICDVTGFKRWRSELSYQWNGLLVLPEAWDPRPQYMEVPNTHDNITVPDARTPGPDVLIFPVPSDLDNVPNF